MKEDGRWKEGSKERGGKREVRCISEETALEGREVRPFLGWLLKVRFGSAGLAETKTRQEKGGFLSLRAEKLGSEADLCLFSSIRKRRKVQLKSFSAFLLLFSLGPRARSEKKKRKGGAELRRRMEDERSISGSLGLSEKGEEQSTRERSRDRRRASSIENARTSQWGYVDG